MARSESCGHWCRAGGVRGVAQGCRRGQPVMIVSNLSEGFEWNYRNQALVT
jgi:hypothetical protein